ncbi:CPBP family intramembrane glutamic endopeptidase, partial [Halorubrum sp. Atlit-26R]|uniref:CPBP family intramembrane glutamic endopeptidase n=1 Tax=Halorubrum sp. Atlit-26R TaxID=2282128 RepID=UPI0011C3F527
PYFLKSIISLLIIFILISIILFSFKYGKSLLFQIAFIISVILVIFVAQKLLNIKIFEKTKYSIRDIYYIVAGYIAIIITDYVYGLFFSLETSNQVDIESSFQQDPLILSIISLAIMPALIEEYIFRGLLLKVLFKNHLFIGVIISSIFFALFHYSDNIFDYIPYFVSGLIFSIVYLKTQKL